MLKRTYSNIDLNSRGMVNSILKFEKKKFMCNRNQPTHRVTIQTKAMAKRSTEKKVILKLKFGT